MNIYGEIQIQYDPDAFGFTISQTVEGEMMADAFSEKASQISDAALAFGKRLLDEHGFLTIPVRMTVPAALACTTCG